MERAVIRNTLSVLGAAFALLSAVGGLVEVFQPAHSLLASELTAAYLPPSVKPFLPYTLFGISALYLLVKGSQLATRPRVAVGAVQTSAPVPLPPVSHEVEVAQRLLSRDEKERLKQQAKREARDAVVQLDGDGTGLLVQLARAATAKREAEEQVQQAGLLLEDSRRTLAEAVKSLSLAQEAVDAQRAILRDALTFIPGSEQSPYTRYLPPG
jgi:hypothetical protein